MDGSSVFGSSGSIHRVRFDHVLRHLRCILARLKRAARSGTAVGVLGAWHLISDFFACSPREQSSWGAGSAVHVSFVRCATFLLGEGFGSSLDDNKPLVPVIFVRAAV